MEKGTCVVDVEDKSGAEEGKKQAAEEKKRKEEAIKIEKEFMETFESGQPNDKRKTFYFKRKFKEISGL